MSERKHIPNPTGKGGFVDNPENRANGRWSKENSIPYCQNMFIRMTVEEFLKWEQENPPSKRTMAQQIAYKSVVESEKELNYLKEVTDRTSGKPSQSVDIDHKNNGQSFDNKEVIWKVIDAEKK